MSVPNTEEYFERGIQFFRAGFFSNALKEFKEVEKIDPNYPNIGYLIAATQKKVEEVTGKLVSSIEENFDEEIIKLSETVKIEGANNLLSEILYLIKNDRPFEAIEKLKNAASFVPDSKPLLLLTAYVYRKIGKLKEAEETLLRAKTLYPKDGEILNNLGNVYLAQNHFKEAREHFYAALEVLEDNFVIRNNLGTLEMQCYRLDDACKIFEDIVRKYPTFIPARKNLENLRRRISELDKEIAVLRKEYQEHPTYFDIGINLGKALLFRGYFSEAKNVLEDIVSKKPDLVAAYFYLGTLNEIEGSLDKAIFWFQKMVMIKGQTESSEYKRFLALNAEGYKEEALEEIKKVAVLELNLAAGHINIGIRYFEEANWKRAIEYFDAAIKINDSYPDAYYWKALSKIQLGKKNEAIKELQRALEINPQYADAHYQLGMLLRKSAPKRAAKHFEQALKAGVRSQFAEFAKDWLKKIES